MLTEADKNRFNYNTLDVMYTYEIATIQQELISALPNKLKDFYKFQITEVAPALIDIMNHGVKIDLEKKALLKQQLTQLADEVKAKIDWLVGEPFNSGSTTQVKILFKDLLGIKLTFNKKTKTESCASAFMFQYMEEYPEYKVLISLILELRSINVFLKTFINAELDSDNRLRTSYNCAGTKTYRLSSRKNAFGNGMNLQNLPSKGKIDLKYALENIDSATSDDDEPFIIGDYEGLTELPNIKELFIPDKDHIFFDMDLSAADARIVAYESNCKFLIDIFENPELDLYSILASHYYQRDISKKDKERQIFKSVCHASNYLGKAPTIALAAKLSVKEVETVQKWYFKQCLEVSLWHKKIIKDVQTKGYVENVFGARGWHLNKDDKMLYNKATAWVGQSTIAILINKILTTIHYNEPKIKILLQTHDSISGQFHKLDLTAAERILTRSRIELPFIKPLIIPTEVKISEKNYGDCH